MPEGSTPGSAEAEEWKRVRQVLHHALESPAELRPAYLDEACGDDHGLRAEVESLLAAAERSAFLDRPAVAPATDDDSILEPGRRIAHYQVVEKIGEGGMGAVYKAVDTRLDRPVALKVISRAHGDWTQERRFAREAKAASALNHPNIVTIYEFNSQDGLDYIAMEYVQGTTLNQLVSEQKLPLPTLLEYARQAAAALAKAHAAGIVHRDLKPGNIMVTADGDVKVLDFGLAKRTKERGRNPDVTETQLTRQGAVSGTPAYMSPEQARGEAEDWRSDIFSFGVILYELACGHRPFQGKDTLDTMYQIAHGDPGIPEELSRPLAALIRGCLEKDRERRIQSMADVATALEQNRDRQGADAPPNRSSRRTWLTGAVLAAAAIAASIWLSHTGPVLTYTIEAQRMRDTQPLGDPYTASEADTFEGGWRFRLRVRPEQPGYLSLINQGPGETGAARFWVLSAGAVPGKQEAVTGWYVFDTHPGTEKLWIVWSAQPLAAVSQGPVESQDAAQATERLLAGLKRGQRTADRNGASQVKMAGSSETLAELLELKHR